MTASAMIGPLFATTGPASGIGELGGHLVVIEVRHRNTLSSDRQQELQAADVAELRRLSGR